MKRSSERVESEALAEKEQSLDGEDRMGAEERFKEALKELQKAPRSFVEN